MLPSAKEERPTTEPQQAGATCLDAKAYKKEQEFGLCDCEISSSASQFVAQVWVTYG